VPRLLRDAGFTVLSRSAQLGLGIAASVILARYLGPTGKGEYALAILLPAMIVSFTNAGIGPATVFFTSRKGYARRDILRSNTLLVIVASLISIALAAIVLLVGRDMLFPDLPLIYLVIALTLIPGNLLFRYLNSLLLGEQRIIAHNALVLSRNGIFFFVIVVALAGFRFGVVAAVLSWLVADVLSGLALVGMAKRGLSNARGKVNFEYLRSALRYGWRAHLANVFSYLYLRLDMILIGAISGSAAVGYYSVAVGVAERLWLVPSAISTTLLPRLAADKGQDGARASTPVVTRIILLVSAVVSALLAVLAKLLVGLLFSEAFLQAVRPLQILLLGVIAASAGMLLGNDLAARGRPDLNAWINGFSCVLNLVLNLLWIPRYGIDGAAWATSLSYVVAFLFRMAVYCRVSGNRCLDVLVPRASDARLLWSSLRTVLQRSKRSASS